MNPCLHKIHVDREIGLWDKMTIKYVIMIEQILCNLITKARLSLTDSVVPLRSRIGRESERKARGSESTENASVKPKEAKRPSSGMGDFFYDDGEVTRRQARCASVDVQE